jgi:type IV pilus assembly protein PilA
MFNTVNPGYILIVSDAGSKNTGGQYIRFNEGTGDTHSREGEKKMLMVLKQQLKKNKKKGFTLVEVIVVLVILAILAAIAIPALTGYIDKANEKAVISQVRSTVVAAQTIVSEGYQDGSIKPLPNAQVDVTSKVDKAAVVKLSGDNTIETVDTATISGPAIYKIKITTTGGKKGYFFNGTYSTTTPAAFGN